MERRQSLQEFQARLAQRLADPAADAHGSDWLGIAWRGVHALLPLAQAGEVSSPVALQPVPHTAPWVMGVAALRGGIGLVVDWVALLGLARESPTVASAGADDDAMFWVSLGRGAGLSAALCADRLLGLHRRSGFVSLQEPSATDDDLLVRAWADATGQRWHEIDLWRLVQSPPFLHPHRPGFDTEAA
jgi:twitching motility protein PilI